MSPRKFPKSPDSRQNLQIPEKILSFSPLTNLLRVVFLPHTFQCFNDKQVVYCKISMLWIGGPGPFDDKKHGSDS